MPRITSRSKAARFAICLSRENYRIYFGEWVAFLESVKGVRLGGADFAGSQLIFPGRDGAPFSNQAFNARIKLACRSARRCDFALFRRVGGRTLFVSVSTL